MPFQSAVSSGNKTNLRRNTWQANTYVIVRPNTTVMSARVLSVSTSSSFAEVPFYNASGASDIDDGMTVLISRTNDKAEAFFVGRVRDSDVTGDTLRINETSTALAVDDYIFVIKDDRMQQRLARDDNGTIKTDWNNAFRELLPVVYDLQSVYVVTLSGGQADLALAPSAIATTFGAAISTWAWSLDGGTFASGSASSQNITARYTSAGEYRVTLTVTDDGGRSIKRVVYVYVSSADYSDSFIATGVESLSINADVESGWNGSIGVFNGVTDVLDNTAITVFSVDRYGSTQTSIVSNVMLYARIRTESDDTVSSDEYAVLPTASFQLEGPTTQFSRLKSPSIALEEVASPGSFGQINTLTVWRAIVFLLTEFYTFANIHSVNFDSVADTFRTDLLSASDVSGQQAINSLASSINAALQAAPQGEFEIRRSARFLSGTDRDALTTVIDYNTTDLFNYNRSHEHVLQVARFVGFGAVYNSVSDDVAYIRAIAPAVAPNDGSQNRESNGQILAANTSNVLAKAEMAQRVANELVARNPIDKLTVVHPDGYHNIVNPDNGRWYTFTIAASTNIRNVSYDTNTRWLCESVNIGFDLETGTRSVSVVYAEETEGTDAISIAEVAPDAPVPVVPDYPIFNPFPGLPVIQNPYLPSPNPLPIDLPPLDPGDLEGTSPNPTLPPEILTGDVVAVWNADGLWQTRNYTKTSAPSWTGNIAPETAAITDFQYDTLGEGDGQGRGAWLLANDGTDTAVWYTANMFQQSPNWTVFAVLSGVFEFIRLTGEPSTLYVLGNNSQNADIVTFDLGGYPAYTVLQGALGGGGNPGNCVIDTATGITSQTVEAISEVEVDLQSDTSITDLAMDWWFSQPAGITLTIKCTAFDSGGNSLGELFNVTINRDVVDQEVWESYTNNSVSQSGVRKLVFWARVSTSVGGNPIQVRIDNLSWNGGTSPTSLVSRYSTDTGLTWSSNVSVGTTPGNSFATATVGDIVYAGNSGGVRTASAGGAYSDATGAQTGTPLCVWSYDTGNDEIVYADSTNTYTVEGGTPTDITPNDGSDDGIAVSGNCLAMTPGGDTEIFSIADYGTPTPTRKVAYYDGSTWANFTTLDDANYIRVRNESQIYISADTALHYSPDKLANTYEKDAPADDIVGIEVR